MILQNFKLSEDKSELIGLNGKRLLEFFKLFASKHSSHKMYCIKIIEVRHSDLSRNYLYMLLGEYADETGVSQESLEKRYMHKLDLLIRADLDDRYTKKIFFDEEIVDTDTGELLIESKLKSISKFNQTALNRFIDLVVVLIQNEMPEFIIPDPAKYMFERRGQKNELLFPEEKIILK